MQRGMRNDTTQPIEPNKLTLGLSFIRFAVRGNWRAWRVRALLRRSERMMLYRLGLACPRGGEMLEVGSYVGASACFLGAAAQERGARLHCIDTWQNDSMMERKRDTFAEFQHNTARYAKQLLIHRGDSLEIARTFEGQVDLLFIDAGHSYEECCADIGAWLPHLRAGGMVAFHDYPSWEGVRRAVDELARPQMKDARGVYNLFWGRI